MERSRRWGWIPTCIVLTLLLAGPVGYNWAQAPDYYPETGHYLRGSFREFWLARGGLEQFGYPITEEFVRTSDGRVVQYFERARFELGTLPDGRANVMLGLIGREYLDQDGQVFAPIAPTAESAGLRYFAETRHTLRGTFKHYWELNGGLALFGYPISEETSELLEDGRTYVVQYFERARFELVNGRVRLGRLGVRLAPCQLRPALPAGSAPAAPVEEGYANGCGGVANIAAMGMVYPSPARPGETLGFIGRNFAPGETVSLWINLPGGGVRSVPYQAVADDRGGVLIGLRTNAEDVIGRYALVAQGTQSTRLVVAPFNLE